MIFFIHKICLEDLQKAPDPYLQLLKWTENGRAISLEGLDPEEKLTQWERLLAHPYYQMVRIDEHLPNSWKTYTEIESDGYCPYATRELLNKLASKQNEIEENLEQQEEEIQSTLDQMGNQLPASSRIALQERLVALENESWEILDKLKQWIDEEKDRDQFRSPLRYANMYGIQNPFNYATVYAAEIRALHVQSLMGLPLQEQIRTAQQAEELVQLLIPHILEQEEILYGTGSPSVTLYLYSDRYEPVRWQLGRCEPAPIEEQYPPKA
ncbi:hypothetical protein [Paenibacillus bovis]|uniref:Uncharacterized protein n=1 Tax=Paenibacillus bovis TaxID=1616788 RepID=A0A1X9T4C2_9BACL|nr:hypothetical protein [Paenibacillus bovis]ARR10771.1 hypothetical protein AR543_p0163 [Paenibacillus bovis]